MRIISEGDFDFDQWAEMAELTRKTVKYLRSEELMTVRILSLINEKDIVMMPLPLGQCKLLIASARELVGDSSHPVQPPSVIHTPTIPEHPDGTRDNTGAPLIQIDTSDVAGASADTATVNGQLGQLFAQIQTAQTTGEPVTILVKGHNRVDLNPLAYILPRQKVKYLDITEFVQPMGQELTQEEVTPMQWSAANMRVLIELLRTGELKECSIYDYISYTVKVSELADTYVWVSVMRFDRAYRQLQAQNGFRWGSDSPHLDALHLRVRQPGQQFPANSHVTQPPKTASNNQGSRPNLNRGPNMPSVPTECFDISAQPLDVARIIPWPCTANRHQKTRSGSNTPGRVCI